MRLGRGVNKAAGYGLYEEACREAPDNKFDLNGLVSICGSAMIIASSQPKRAQFVVQALIKRPSREGCHCCRG
jgi:hypothetical protein